jgi:hypothetical protein
MEVVIGERVADEQHVPGQQHRLHNPGQGHALTLEAQVVISGEDDPVAVVDRAVQLQQPHLRALRGDLRQHDVLPAGVGPGPLEAHVEVGRHRLTDRP